MMQQVSMRQAATAVLAVAVLAQPHHSASFDWCCWQECCRAKKLQWWYHLIALVSQAFLWLVVVFAA
jgi:hypothetical protein